MSGSLTHRKISDDMQLEMDWRHLEAVAMIASAGMAYADFDPKTMNPAPVKKRKRSFDSPVPIGI